MRADSWEGFEAAMTFVAELTVRQSVYNPLARVGKYYVIVVQLLVFSALQTDCLSIHQYPSCGLRIFDRGVSIHAVWQDDRLFLAR